MRTDEDEQLPVEGSMSFLDHLEELRKRLISGSAAVLILSITAFTFHKEILEILMIPYREIMGDEAKLQTIAPLESFYVSVKLSFLSGFFAGAPFLLYQAWKFIAPGLYPSERKWVIPFVTLGTVFFFSGAAFGFFVVFPMVVSFLSEFNLEVVSSQYTLEKYVSFASLILLSFG